MNHYQYDPKNTKGKSGKAFYVALGVCLIAVGIAAWSTYDSVVSFSNPKESASSGAASSKETAPAQNTVSGVPAYELPETVSSSSSRPPESESSGSSSPAESKAAPAASPKVKPSSSVSAAIEYHVPVSGAVTKNFSGQNPIFSETMQDWRVHSGVDLGAKTGETVKAIAGGVVTKTAMDDLLGNSITIRHEGGVIATYCGLGDTFLVKEGETVRSGQDIGSVSAVPCESAERPHLHLEIVRDGKLIDPLTLLTSK